MNTETVGSHLKYIKNIYNWNSPDLNNILYHAGTYLHSCIKGSLKKYVFVVVNKSVPSMVSINEKTYA